MRILAVIAAAGLALAAPSAVRADSGVVATIKPLHSLVAGVMQGVGTPDLLIPGTASPHTYSLKPSDARRLAEARVVFWIGPEIETPLEHPIETLAAKATIETMIEAPGIVQRMSGESGDHAAHTEKDGDKDAHHKHGHDDDHDKDAHHKPGHDDDHDKDAHHKPGHDDDHDKDAHHKHEHDDDHAGQGHGDHDGHHHGPEDPHVWLDPENARAMVAAIATSLSEAMPEHADTFRANAERMSAELAALTEEVRGILEPVWFQPFLVFHDAYIHFEDRFGLPGSEAIVVNPEIRPGAKRIAELRDELVDDGIVCVFIEPQFDPSIAEVIVEGTDVRIGTLDPLGSDIPEGPALYSQLIRSMATTLRDCLGGS